MLWGDHYCAHEDSKRRFDAVLADKAANQYLLNWCSWSDLYIILEALNFMMVTCTSIRNKKPVLNKHRSFTFPVKHK